MIVSLFPFFSLKSIKNIFIINTFLKKVAGNTVCAVKAPVCEWGAGRVIAPDLGLTGWVASLVWTVAPAGAGGDRRWDRQAGARVCRGPCLGSGCPGVSVSRSQGQVTPGSGHVPKHLRVGLASHLTPGPVSLTSQLLTT